MLIDTVTENLYYLLWKHGISQKRWPAQLRSWTQCESIQRANDLLFCAKLESNEQDNLCEVVETAADDLQYRRLVQDDCDVNILHNNIKFLIDHLGHGQKTELANRIGVHSSNIAKWLRDQHEPTPTHVTGLMNYFALPSETDLRADPLFLYPFPVIDIQRREWLKQHVDAMSAIELRELFPGLRKLLENTQ